MATVLIGFRAGFFKGTNYRSLLNLFRSTALDLTELTNRWIGIVLTQFQPLAGHGHRTAVEERLNDMIVTPDGRNVFWINPAFYELPVRKAQIRRVSKEKLDVYVVPAATFTTKHIATIEERLRERVGDMEISTNITESMARSANGKFRSVVNELL